MTVVAALGVKEHPSSMGDSCRLTEGMVLATPSKMELLSILRVNIKRPTHVDHRLDDVFEAGSKHVGKGHPHLGRL